MTLIVFANPGKGHCYGILEQVKSLLDEKKEKYDALDLYQMKFNPVLSAEEHYTSGNKFVSEEVQAIQKKISEHEKLIFIFPIWWGTMPAMMKGFFDRVFTSGFAFKYVNRLPIGLLNGKKAAVFMTTGAPDILNSLGVTNASHKGVNKEILAYCGIKSKIFRLGDALHIDANKAKISNLAKKGVSWLY